MTRLAAFILELTYSSLYFQNQSGPPWLGKRHLSAVESAKETVELFFESWHTATSFMHLPIQSLNSQEVIMNCAYELVDVWPCYLFLTKQKQLSENVVAQTVDVNSQSFFLPSHLIVQQTGLTCIDALHTVVSCMKLSRDLFLSLATLEQLHHRYLQQCLSLLTHQLNLYRGILFLKSVSNRPTVNVLSPTTVAVSFMANAICHSILTGDCSVPILCVHDDWANEPAKLRSPVYSFFSIFRIYV